LGNLAAVRMTMRLDPPHLLLTGEL